MCASIAAGAFLGATRSKLFAAKSENKFHVAFYIFGGATIIAVIVSAITFSKEFFSPIN